MEGDLARTIETEFDRIGHIQLADNPGRFSASAAPRSPRNSHPAKRGRLSGRLPIA